MLGNMAEHCGWYLLAVNTMAQKRSGDVLRSSGKVKEVSKMSSCGT